MSYEAVSEELHQTLLTILQQQQITTCYQPIVSFAEQQIIGYECLIRAPRDSCLHLPFDLFHTAACSGHLLDLEHLSLQLAIDHFCQQKLHGKLFMNLSIASLVHPLFSPDMVSALLSKQGMSTTSLVFDLVNVDRHVPLFTLKQTVLAYQKIGCQFTLDDFGSSQANFKMWAELRPNYIKVDPYFVENLHTEYTKKEILRSLRNVATRLNCELIIEGIQSAADYQAVRQLNLPLGQGFYFAKPVPEPLHQLPAELFELDKKTDFLTYTAPQSQRSSQVSCLIIEAPHAKPTQSVEVVSQIFYKNPHIHSIPIVNNDGIPVGIVRRHELMQLFLNRYGRDLHGRKPINQFMEINPLMFDVHMTLEEASRRLTSNVKLVPEHDFIICDQGVYVGLGQVMNLLRKITELQIRNARYANPLTQLPGNVPIQEYIEELLSKRQEFAVAYCDLDNFKPYNDVYGYDKGDRVIKSVAKILTQHAHPQTDFVGHVGGDDFILVMQSLDWQARCQAILDEFELLAPSFYNAEHRAAKGIHAVDRKGKETFYALLSLSIGAVIPDIHHCQSHHDVAALASESKHHAKKHAGNQLHIEKRHIPSTHHAQ